MPVVMVVVIVVVVMVVVAVVIVVVMMVIAIAWACNCIYIVNSFSDKGTAVTAAIDFTGAVSAAAAAIAIFGCHVAVTIVVTANVAALNAVPAVTSAVYGSGNAALKIKNKLYGMFKLHSVHHSAVRIGVVAESDEFT